MYDILKISPIKYPSWNLGGHKIENTNMWNPWHNISCDAHIYKRANVSHRTMYALASMGYSYPGLAIKVKENLWKTIGLTSLFYNLDIFTHNPGQQEYIERVQSSIIQRIVGFFKGSRHTGVLMTVLNWWRNIIGHS